MRPPEPSTRLLKLLAATVWGIGAIELLWKGSVLLREAEALAAEPHWLWTAGLGGLGAGVVKGLLLFDRACRRNLARIDALERRYPRSFFRVPFFFALGAMIAVGASLSRAARGDPTFLMAVAALDLSIGAALALSFRHFLSGERVSARG
ncbi:MAG: hypothetical protein P1V51_22180 [Deltaproteobacteria bacterium]|nr:hypothetical protein [Deltaproteobacteria bacterium]